MSVGVSKAIPLDKSLDGTRILFRYFLQTSSPREGWVREFSADGKHVRISRSNSMFDAGVWFRVSEMAVEAVLDEAKAPAVPSRNLKEKEGEEG